MVPMHSYFLPGIELELTKHSIEGYHSSTATLFLKHGYPRASQPVVAFTNLDMVIDQLKHTTIQDGGWVNIVGYVREHTAASCVTDANVKYAPSPRHVHVQAIMVWEAAALQLETYETTVQMRIKHAMSG
jgi:hypothetical protein